MRRKTPSLEDDDKLKDSNKKLRSQLRQLRKLLKQKELELENIRDLVDWDELRDLRDERRQKIEAKRSPECQSCGSTNMEVTQLGIYERQQCQDCGLTVRSKM